MQLFSADASMFSKIFCPWKHDKNWPQKLLIICQKIFSVLAKLPERPNAGPDFGSTRSKTYFLQTHFSSSRFSDLPSGVHSDLVSLKLVSFSQSDVIVFSGHAEK